MPETKIKFPALGIPLPARETSIPAREIPWPGMETELSAEKNNPNIENQPL
jgi:hypothetical protein